MSQENASSKPKIIQLIGKFDDMHQGFAKNDAIIEGFINSLPLKTKKSELFEVLVSVYDLFKSEFTVGTQIRELALRQKQEIKALKNDLRSFCNIFSQYSGNDISSLKEAKDFVFNCRQTELTSKELRETETELRNERQKASKLELENREIQQKMKDLALTIKDLEDNTERVTNKLRMNLKEEKNKNMNLSQELEFIKQENKTFMTELCNIENIEHTEDKNALLRHFSMKNNKNKVRKTPKEIISIRTLMIVSMFSVRIQNNVNNNMRMSQLQKEIAKAKIKTAQIGNW